MARKRPLFIFALILIAYFPVIGMKTYSPDSHVILPPLFESSLLDYLRMVLNFETVDFQPVRDLTFYIDVMIFKLTGISSLSFTNVLFWALSCFLLLRLLKRIPTKQKELTLVLLVGAFAVYPLFSQAVSWTMARKHVLALTLILFSTHFYLDWREGKRKWMTAFLVYVAAVLSHPIVTFWPVWAMLHHWAKEKTFSTEAKKFYVLISVTMLVLLLTNYAYYVVLNERLQDYYTQARPSFSLSQVLIYAGYYFKNLLFPYHLAYTYYPDLSNSWPGFVVIGALVGFTFKQRKNLTVLSWIAFALFPFPVFIGLSVYDQYLLVPAVGLFIAAILVLPEIKKPFYLLPFILFWCAFTLNETRKWPQPGEISLRNFRNAPSCKSVIEAISSLSLTEINVPSEVLNYFEEKNCFSILPQIPPAEKPKVIVARSLTVFSGNSSINQQAEALKFLGKVHYYPLLVYSVLMARNGNLEEVKWATDYIYERTQGPVENSGPLMEKVLAPYCRLHELSKCLVLLEGKRPERPYF